MSQPPNFHLDGKNFPSNSVKLLLDKRFSNMRYAHTVLITVKGGHRFLNTEFMDKNAILQLLAETLDSECLLYRCGAERRF
jgi:hypothetical protein